MKRILFFLIVAVAASTAHAALKIESWTLANGARVLFVENHSIPIFDLNIEFDAGSRRDSEGKIGTAAMTNAMLARGMRAGNAANEPVMSEAEISDAFADIAAQRAGGTGNDRGGVSLRTLANAAERERGVFLLARLLAHPSFPEDFLARDKARTIANIKEALTKPEVIGARAFSRLAYGKHPYSYEETVESISAITRDDLIAFHQRHYVANRAVVSMIGDISRAQADAIARQLTERLPQGEALPSMSPVDLPKGQEERIAHPATQAHILIGAPAVVRGDPDYFPLLVGNYVLGGGGFVSRLMKEVREKEGLAYSVYSYFSPMLQEGPFEIGLQTKKDQTDKAIDIVRKTVADFLRDGPTAEELKAAKDNLIGGFPLRIDNNRKILDNIAMIGFYNMPLNYLDTWADNVAKVTIADIKAAFSRKVAVDKLATVIVGNAK
ncbi:MAG: insulinase family protein [Burkholderiales bacterium]|nr:insulinase family protein [Burkholderiales bacterium]